MNSKNNTSSRVCQIFEKLNLEKNSSGQIIDFSSPNQRHPPFLYFWSVSYIFFAAKIPLPNYEKIVISYRFIVFKMTAQITLTDLKKTLALKCVMGPRYIQKTFKIWRFGLGILGGFCKFLGPLKV